MPTDLPPDYKPRPLSDPVGTPTAPGPDSPGEPVDVPQPGPNTGVPGPGADVIDPPGWAEPPLGPGGLPSGVPTPAGTPSF